MSNSHRSSPSPSDHAVTAALAHNQASWDQLAVAGDQFFRAVSPEQIAAARNGDYKIRITPQRHIPRDWLEPIAARTVLCLAAAGGQQAPLLAAAGANVTVFDLSEKQLARDREIAEREGLTITTLVGDMADLSRFADRSFDVIINPCSVCYCPDVKPIWQHCARILKPGAALITGLINPLYYLFDAVKMDRGQLVVRHAIPYSDFDLTAEERTRILGEHRPREFGHSLEDLIGAQLNAGLALTGFFEDGWGDNDSLSSFIPTFIATRAIRPRA